MQKTSNLKLTEEQNKAYKEVELSIDNNEYKRYLLYGVTGSRENRNIFTINTESYRKTKNSNCISTRNITNATNVR